MTDGISSVAISPDGQSFISGSQDKTVRLWNTQGELLQSFRGHQDARIWTKVRLLGLQLQRGGAIYQETGFFAKHRLLRSYRSLVVFWLLGGAIFWTTVEEFFKTLPWQMPFWLSSLLSSRAPMWLWLLFGLVLWALLMRKEGDVTSVAFSPDGKTIVTGGTDGTLRLWSRWGKLIRIPFLGHEGAVTSVTFSPDGKYIVSGGQDKTVRLWNRGGKPICKPFKGHEGAVTSVAFSPDSQTIVSGSQDKTLQLWNRRGNRISKPFQGHEIDVTSVAFSPNSKTIISGCWDGTIRLWNRQGRPIGKPLIGHEDAVTSVAISPDGQYAVSGSQDQTIRLWDIQSNSNNLFKEQAVAITSVTLSPDGQLIVSGCEDGTVRLWNQQGNLIGKPFEGHEGVVTSVAFSPDGQLIASGGQDKTVRLWDKQGNSIGQPFCRHEDIGIWAKFYLLVRLRLRYWFKNIPWLWRWLQINFLISMFLTIILFQLLSWNTDDAETFADAVTFVLVLSLLLTLIELCWFFFYPLEDEGVVTSVAFSPDGKYIVSGSKDKTVRVWDIQGNLVGQPFVGHKYEVTSVTFSPDSKYIISGSKDETVRVWDKQGNLVGQSFLDDQDDVNSIANSLDRQTIVSDSNNNWKALLQVACGRLRDHPVLKNFETDMAEGARETCERYIWK